LNRSLIPRVAGGDRHLRAALQVEAVSTLDEHGTRPRAGAYHRTDGGAFAASGDGANDGPERRAYRAALHGRPGLAVVAVDRPFAVYPNCRSIRRADFLDDPVELI
jgi:hypothetical protein